MKSDQALPLYRIIYIFNATFVYFTGYFLQELFFIYFWPFSLGVMVFFLHQNHLLMGLILFTKSSGRESVFSGDEHHSFNSLPVGLSKFGQDR